MNQLTVLITLAAMATVAHPVLADDRRDSDARPSEWGRLSAIHSAGDDLDIDASDKGDEHDTPDRLRLYDESGRRTGRVERHPVFEDTLDLYDDRGARTGRVRQNPSFEDRLDVYDDRGRRVQQIRKHPVFDDQYDIYDERGRRVGSVRENPVIEGRYDIYDERGRRTGRAEAQ